MPSPSTTWGFLRFPYGKKKKKFWQNVKPLFSNKVKAKTVIKLVENDAVIDDESKIAKIFNEYFVTIVKKVGILTEEQITYLQQTV